MITFSVVTITYNAASVLAPTLDSVLMQNYPHVEHIIIDGASTDSTVAIAKAYQQRSDEAENDAYRYAYKANLTMDSTTL